MNTVEFIRFLFDREDVIEIRCFASKGGLNVVKRLYYTRDSFQSSIPEIAKLNETLDVYFGVNPRIKEGGKSDCVSHANCLCLDIDDFDAMQTVSFIESTCPDMPPPSVVVNSGHGAHAYWRLAEPIKVEDWSTYQQKLAILLGGDEKIKDAPRLMRLPGFINHGNGSESPTKCEVVAEFQTVFDFESLADVLDQNVKAPKVLLRPTGIARPGVKLKNNLTRQTLDFIAFGCSEGERNIRLFKAACDLLGNGYPPDEIFDILTSSARKCGLDDAEIRATIESALSKPRIPSKPLDRIDETVFVDHSEVADSEAVSGDGDSCESEEGDSDSGSETAMDYIQPGISFPPQDNSGIVISNVMDKTEQTEDGKSRRVSYYINPFVLSKALFKAANGWPRIVSGVPFVWNPEKRKPGERLSNGEEIQYIDSEADFFAWLHRKFLLRWHNGTATHPSSGELLNAITKSEFFSLYSSCMSIRYETVEMLPTYPAQQNTFYLPCDLPEVDFTKEDTPLKQLLSGFNVATDVDRILLLSALMTPGWGGAYGARPMFVITSDYGRGTGKTTTAEVISEIWGGAFYMYPSESWDQAKKRLMSDEAMRKRCVILDNVRGILQGTDIESAITAQYIDGWRPYFGHLSRPNNLTWFVTLNAPSLSEDVADRSIIIKMGEQKYEHDFRTWALEHIRKYRPEIISEILSILRDCDGGEAKITCRWVSWQKEVLSKIEGYEEALGILAERRVETSTDRNDLEEIIHHLKDEFTQRLGETPKCRVFFSRKFLKYVLNKYEITDDHMPMRRVCSYVRTIITVDKKHRLAEYKSNGIRGWLYDPKSEVSPEEYTDNIARVNDDFLE
ncbi:MAG: hypothetical protein KatS3mg104_3039 [Phycisphaerae bacterium]|nr:MAG: hypothetical protein KatS3mg104_3039 [Phycisphaerae bacterium]